MTYTDGQLDADLIVPIPLADALTDLTAVPDGTTASRCRACGETRVQYPGSLLDPWRKHFDYCDGEGQQ